MEAYGKASKNVNAFCAKMPILQQWHNVYTHGHLKTGSGLPSGFDVDTLKNETCWRSALLFYQGTYNAPTGN
jgi:hypothetical protein